MDPLTVAGIDVGGRKKGFHAVALEDGVYREQFASSIASEVADWCRGIGARYVGVDAPCRWSVTGRARPAETELMRKGIFCFPTPRQQVAEEHKGGFFDWMLNGADLFHHLASSHRLFDGTRRSTGECLCFETFPQAIACALSGAIVSAKVKRTVRRELLMRVGLDVKPLTNIDRIDAALCALTAHYLASGRIEKFGDPATGFIVVPVDPLDQNPPSRR